MRTEFSRKSTCLHVHVRMDSYVAGSASVSYQYCISCRCDCPITLLRIYCIMFSNLSVFFYPSTSSSVVNVCDGANVTLTCVTDTGTLIWATATGGKTFKSGFMENSSSDALGDNFIVRLTNETNMTLTSDLTIVAPPPSLHETIILCRDDGYPVSASVEKTLLISYIIKR